MKPADVRQMTDEQLETTVRDLRAEWRDLRFQEAVGQLTATARIRAIRKDIARILTIRTERQLDAATRALLSEQGTTRA